VLEIIPPAEVERYFDELIAYFPLDGHRTSTGWSRPTGATGSSWTSTLENSQISG
jgi:hypothetical protein